jgi:hypothetical protein
MLSRFRCFSHRKPRCSLNNFATDPPPRLRDLRAMISRFRRVLAPKAQVFTEHPPIPRPRLKRNPYGDLCAMQGQLIEEIVGAFIVEIIIKIPVTDLGKDAPRELAA